MSTYTQIIYHIVFSTKKRELTLTKNNRDLLYKYISGLLKNKKCHLYQINGIEDHIHIVTHLHPTVALSSLIKDIKLSSSLFIKEQKLFNNFDGWQEGYGAFTFNQKEKDKLIEYVKNQEVHHCKKTFKDEYVKLLSENEIVFDEKYIL
jgi:putative transposase